jgi:HPt (histidine-containing phosphotransfer) domain-containing protein
MSDMDTVVSWAQALHAVGGDEQLLKAVIEAFLEETPTLVKQIRQAIDERQAATLHRVAHTLKGNLRYFGNERASELALSLEVMGRQAAFETAPATLSDLEPHVDSVLRCLAAYVGPEAA